MPSQSDSQPPTVQVPIVTVSARPGERQVTYHGLWWHNEDGSTIGCSHRPWTSEVRPLLRDKQPSGRADVTFTYRGSENKGEDVVGISAICRDQSGNLARTYTGGPSTLVVNAEGEGRVGAKYLETRPLIFMTDVQSESQQHSSFGGKNSVVTLHRAGVYMEMLGDWDDRITVTNPMTYINDPGR